MHVRSASERNAERNVPEEVAQRKPCEDFDEFRLDFEAVQADLETGRQSTELFKTSSRSQIRKGDWFIVDGQKALVAETVTLVPSFRVRSKMVIVHQVPSTSREAYQTIRSFKKTERSSTRLD